MANDALDVLVGWHTVSAWIRMHEMACIRKEMTC